MIDRTPRWLRLVDKRPNMAFGVMLVILFTIFLTSIVYGSIISVIFRETEEDADETTEPLVAVELRVREPVEKPIYISQEEAEALNEEIADRIFQIDKVEQDKYVPEPEEVKTVQTFKSVSAPVCNYYNIPLSNDIQDYMFQECSRYGIPSGLVVAIMETESRFTIDIISRTNDYGLMQINQCAHEWLNKNLGVTNLLDAKQNILSGIYILRYHLDYCNGDLKKALMCYACGAGRAETYFEQGIYETEYTKSLIERAERWEAQLGIN